MRINPKTLYATNIRLVYQCIIAEETTSKAAISSSLGLSFATVSKACHELSAAGYISEEEEGKSSGGRKPALIRFLPEGKFIFVLDFIISDRATLSLLNLKHQVAAAVQVSIDEIQSIEDFLEWLKYEKEQLIEEIHISSDKIIGIGISVPGLYNLEQDFVTESSIPFINNVNLGRRIHDVLGVPVSIDNDSNIMALGFKFKHSDVEHLLFINFARGIGLGIIINCSEYQGASGYAGELALIPVRWPGSSELLHFEKEVTLKALLCRYIGNTKIDFNQEKALDILLAALVKGEQRALTLMQEAGMVIGQVTALLEDLYNPHLIVIGGNIQPLAGYLIPHIRETTREKSLVASKTDVRIECGYDEKILTACGCGEKVFKAWMEQWDTAAGQ